MFESGKDLYENFFLSYLRFQNCHNRHQDCVGIKKLNYPYLHFLLVFLFEVLHESGNVFIQVLLVSDE